MQTRPFWKLALIGVLLACVFVAGFRIRSWRTVPNTPKIESKTDRVPTQSPVPAASATAPAVTADRADPTPALWPAPTDITGTKLLDGGANEDPRRIGRSGLVRLPGGAPLAGAVKGTLLRLPGFDGEELLGLVHLQKQESHGRTLVGGVLYGTQEGTFSFSDGPDGLAGMILLPRSRTALVLQPAEQPGAPATLVEKPLSAVICVDYRGAAEPAPTEPARNPATRAAATQLVVPILSSRPTAEAVVYMDFDGETVTDSYWNGGITIEAEPAEISAEDIVIIWKRVAEDYAGFNLDVTTDPARYAAAPVGRRMRCIITPTNTAGLASGGIGGISPIGGWTAAGHTVSETIPCWAFGGGVGIAETITHEVGHTFGLLHDGRTSPLEEYFAGHGEGPLSWCPIMGTGYSKNVVQWSKGEYATANNHEDDIAIIASPVHGFGFAPDEAGGTTATATLVQATALGELEVPGVIHAAEDVDVYRFVGPRGRIRLAAKPAEFSPNLDIRLTLRNEAGEVIASDDPEDRMDAAIDCVVPAGGTFYVEIQGAGHGDPLYNGYTNYGSVGAYTIVGAVPAGDGAAVLPADGEVTATRLIAFHHQIRAGNFPTLYVANGLPAGLVLDAATGVISGIPTAPAGSYPVQLQVSNDVGTGTGVLTIILTVEPTPAFAMGALRLLRPGEGTAFAVTATAMPSAFTATGLPAGMSIDAATGEITGTPTVTGSFQVALTATNAAGTGHGGFTLVVGAAGEVVGAGNEYSMFVRADGTLWTAGENSNGQLGIGSTETHTVPMQVATGVRWVQGGPNCSMFIKTDGSLWGMGYSFDGQLGLTGLAQSPVQIAAAATAVAAGQAHLLFVKPDHCLWGLGTNDSGQLGIGAGEAHFTAVPVANGVVAVAAAGFSSAFVKADGTLWACGSNTAGQLGDGTTTGRPLPVPIAQDVFSVAMGDSFIVFLKSDGSLWRTGNANWLSDYNNSADYLPHQVATNVVKVAAFHTTALYTTADGALWLLGYDGQVTRSQPVKIADAAESMAAGLGFVLFASDGHFFGQGSNLSHALADGSSLRRGVPVPIDTQVSSMAAGYAHSLWVKRDGALWGTGQNGMNQLGDGTWINRGTGIHLADGVTTAAGGANHSAFVKADGTLWAMGWLSDYSPHSRPIDTGEKALAVGAGQGYTLWLRPNHSLWGAGANSYGVLSDGTTGHKVEGVQLAGNVAGLAAGMYHALWWTPAGELWGAGWNTNGQLGDGTDQNRTRPVPIATGVLQAAAGELHSLYLTTDHVLHAMGYNTDGRLGDGTTAQRLLPVAVAADVVDLAANSQASFFVKGDNSLWGVGQGIGLEPVCLARGVARVAAKGGHVLILKTDGSLWAMGDDRYGQLGDGITLHYPNPVEIVPGRLGLVVENLPVQVTAGSAATFTVTVTGEGPISYQWRHNGTAITGAEGPAYTVPAAQAADGGTYDVLLTNAHGSLTSSATRLAVLGAAPAFPATMAVEWRLRQPFSYQLPAANEPTAYAASGLPAGLALDPATGLITGTPVGESGTYQVEVTATNAGGTATGQLQLTLLGVEVPVLAVSSTWVVRQGLECAFTVPASSLPQSYAAQDLPAGMVIDVATGAVTGIPTAAAGLYEATLTATNEAGTGRATVRVAVVDSWRDRVAGFEHTLIVDEKGELWGSGANLFGQLGDGTSVDRAMPIPIADHVVCVAASPKETIFFKSDGSLWGMGENNSGLLGQGDAVMHNLPSRIDTDVVAARIGMNHVVYVKSDGTAWASGRNEAGQFGDGTKTSTQRPVQVGRGIADVAAGDLHTLYLHRDGTLWAGGRSLYGQLGDGTYGDRVVPVQIATDVAAISATAMSTYFLKRDGTLWGTGFNGQEAIRNFTAERLYYEPSPLLMADHIVGVWAGMLHMLYLDASGRVWGRGSNEWVQLGGNPPPANRDARIVFEGATFAGAGRNHSLFGAADGSVFVVGINSRGQTADGFAPKQFIPMRIAEDVSQAAAGFEHSLFLRRDGTAWAMGINANGQLGDGTRTERALPVKVADNVARVAAGFWHSAFLKRDGTLWLCGRSIEGELGDVAPSDITEPFLAMSDVAAVSAGTLHTMVLKADGTAWAMGRNIYGQLGTGAYDDHRVPVPVMTGVAEIAAGAYHTLFLKLDGTVWATGENGQGQLGDGTYTSRNAPVCVAHDVAHIFAGARHSLLVMNDATLWGMGNNAEGELGDGTTANREEAIPIATDVRSASGGTYHTAFIKRDGSVWMTGSDAQGQLGDVTPPPFVAGVPQQRTRPVRIATGAVGVATGGTHSLYVRGDGSLWAMGQALNGRLGHGGGLSQWTPRRIPVGLPVIVSQSIPFEINQGEAVEFSVKAVGAGTLAHQWRKDGKPIGGATTPSIVLTGVTATDGGVYDVVVTNAVGSSTCIAVNVAVADAPPAIAGELAISRPRLEDGFSYQVVANNDATVFSAAGLPAGLTIDAATGLISGRITAGTGAVTVQVSATNAYGTGTATLVINITMENPPVVTSATTVLGRQGQDFAYTITGSSDPYAFATENLPAGLSVDAATGLISGRLAAAPGDYLVTLKAANVSGEGAATLRLVVLPAWAGMAASPFNLFVDAAGRLWAWGANDQGQLGDGSEADRSAPKLLATGVVAVAANSGTGLFLKADGSLWATGFLPIFADQKLRQPQQIATRVRACAAGRGSAYYVDWDGTLWGLGINGSGQLGDGTTTVRAKPFAIATDVATVAAAEESAFYVKHDGTAWAMGANAYGQLGDGTTQNRLSPVPVLTHVIAVSAGNYHTLFLKDDGTVWACGNNYGGRLGDGTMVARTTPVSVATGIAAVRAGAQSAFLTAAGELRVVGGSEVAGWTSPVLKTVATSVAGVALSDSHALLLDATTGRLSAAGYNLRGQLGIGLLEWRHPALMARDVVRVSGASNHTIWISQAGNLWGAGHFDNGERGNAVSQAPAIVETQGAVTDLAAGFNCTTYRRADGTLWGMGNNGSGQLGTEDYAVNPARQIATDASMVAAAYGNVFYVSGGHELLGAGENWSGLLGAAGPRHAEFAHLGSDVERVMVPWGGNFAFFLKPDHSLWGLGTGALAQFGLSDSIGNSTPVSLATDIGEAAAGMYHTLYLTRSGVLRAVGSNEFGQIGAGTAGYSNTPVEIAATVRSVGAGKYSSYFVKADGSLWAMGKNYCGELGDGTLQQRNSPELVATGVDAVVGAPDASFIIKRDRTLWGVGTNSYGRLGVPVVTARAEFQEVVLGRPAVDALTVPITAPLGGAAHFAVAASGVGEFTYQWRRDGVAIPGATGAGYDIAVLTANDGGAYDVEISGPRGSIVSESAVFTVGGAAPVIRSARQAALHAGEAFEYRILANNDAYQFTATGLPAGLALDATTGLIRGTPAGGATAYTVILTAANDAGQGSAVLYLGSEGPPGFSAQPQAASAVVGATATFQVTCIGLPEPVLHWQESADNGAHWTDVAEGASYVGAATASLQLQGVTSALHQRQYRCAATNAFGTVYSDPATLTVTSAFAGYLAQHFTGAELNDAAISGPSADPDHDGLPNLLEYAFGTDPRSADLAAQPVVAIDAGKLTFSYIRRTDAPDLTYTVEASGDLVNWTSGATVTEQLSVTPLDATHDRVVERDLVTPTTGSGRFLRLRVTLLSP